MKAVETGSDLAVLQTNERPEAYARLSGRPPRRGEDVVVLGFPFGLELGKDVTVTTGVVSALSWGDDRRLIRISAPVNPGNSGGPLLARNGALLGVVSSKRNEAENVGGAITVATVQSFLDAFGVAYEVETVQERWSTATIAERASQYTRLLGCFKSD